MPCGPGLNTSLVSPLCNTSAQVWTPDASGTKLEKSITVSTPAAAGPFARKSMPASECSSPSSPPVNACAVFET